MSQISIRLSPELESQLKEIAAANGKPLAVYLRSILSSIPATVAGRQEAQEEATAQPFEDLAELKAAIDDLKESVDGNTKRFTQVATQMQTVTKTLEDLTDRIDVLTTTFK